MAATTTYTCDHCGEKAKVANDLQRWGIVLGYGYSGRKADPGQHANVPAYDMTWRIDLCRPCSEQIRLFTNPEAPAKDAPKPQPDLYGALRTVREWMDEVTSDG